MRATRCAVAGRVPSDPWSRLLCGVVVEGSVDRGREPWLYGSRHSAVPVHVSGRNKGARGSGAVQARSSRGACLP